MPRAANAGKAAANPTPGAEEVIKELSLENNYVDLKTGAYLLSPYKITNTNMLENADTEAAVFIEVQFNYVWAFNLHRRTRYLPQAMRFQDPDATEYGGWSGATAPLFHKETWGSLRDMLDLEAKLGFYWQGSDEPTAATIVGGGDFSAEFTLGVPLVRSLYTKEEAYSFPDDGDRDLDLYKATTSAHSVSAIFSYGGTTDKAAFDVHHRILAGLGYRAAVKAPTEDGDLKREVLISLNGGAAWIESVRFANPDVDRTIEIHHGDVPKYRLSMGWGVEGEVHYPLGNQSYISLGSRIYTGQENAPNQWSAFIAITWSLDKMKALFPD